MTSDWQKGGLRYAKLKEIIPAFVAPAPVERFFVAVRSGGGVARLINPLTPLQREYAFVATSDELLVLSLKRPGVFRTGIDNVEYRALIGDVVLEMKKGRLLLANASYQPIAFHDGDAQELVRYVIEKGNEAQAVNADSRETLTTKETSEKLTVS